MRVAGVMVGALVVTLGIQPAYASELPGLTASAETAPNWDDDAGGNANADDPAIWIDTRHPERSVVLGTLKNGGLTVFDLTGKELQRFATPPAPAPGQEPGRFNNVDLIGDLAIVTDRGRDQLRTYAVKSGRLTDVTSADAPLVFSKDTEEVQEQRTAYGLAATVVQGQPIVAVTRRSETRVGYFRLVPDGKGKVTYRPIGKVDLPGSFKLTDGSTWSLTDGQAADGVQHSDGAAVTTQPLGPLFPHGLFAVHDGENTPGDGDREGTNFKLVRLEKLP